MLRINQMLQPLFLDNAADWGFPLSLGQLLLHLCMLVLRFWYAGSAAMNAPQEERWPNAGKHQEILSSWFELSDMNLGEAHMTAIWRKILLLCDKFTLCVVGLRISSVDLCVVVSTLSIAWLFFALMFLFFRMCKADTLGRKTSVWHL